MQSFNLKGLFYVMDRSRDFFTSRLSDLCTTLTSFFLTNFVLVLFYDLKIIDWKNLQFVLENKKETVIG